MNMLRLLHVVSIFNRLSVISVILMSPTTPGNVKQHVSGG